MAADTYAYDVCNPVGRLSPCAAVAKALHDAEWLQRSTSSFSHDAVCSHTLMLHTHFSTSFAASLGVGRCGVVALKSFLLI